MRGSRCTFRTRNTSRSSSTSLPAMATAPSRKSSSPNRDRNSGFAVKCTTAGVCPRGPRQPPFRSPRNAAALTDEVENDQNVPNVVHDDDGRRRRGEPKGCPLDGFQLGDPCRDGRLLDPHVIEGFVENDLVVLVAGQSPSIKL